ncbi:YfgM family protein [Larsenimonas rhizosphaerae]|uniref:Ancillary SecYEG translocon subunit n=1 Tax=Larsenimonas rhizosphaerae TaxID=2944682 RepID=A0AA42CV15_9GAMM|nr:tetratricopeptide repeat protein [Larsenimonas rhizosphaerae]MCM2129895.1 tetratricopeptide repeat protein [Larsenimonas rhizosphaerae]MCX2524556.1 tetratricopeptide repeat protein [Larsenimonas rhizosphaerae]
MVDEVRDDSEQIDAFKRWWKSSGSSIVVGALLAGIAVFGWKYWQSHQESQAAAASARYQQLIQVVGQSTNEQARGEANTLIDQILQKDDGSLYAELARLIQARLAVDDGELDSARSILADVVSNSDDNYVTQVARLNLARLQLAAQTPDKAMSTLENVTIDSLNAQVLALRGDIWKAQGDADKALSAYQQAQKAATDSDQPIFGLQLKIDDLAPKEAP